MSESLILTETPAPGVGLVRLNRPQALNALNAEVTRQAFDALEAFDADDSIGCMILTGSDKAFAAGADIAQMASQSAVDMLLDDFTDWSRLTALRKPVIAAVSGWALGGGCELAMMCDMIVASESARFGQPEIGIGIMPGAGGTQRLTRAVGKAIAMEVMLGDRKLTAAEALQFGLVNRVCPVESYLAEAVALAQKIASQPRLAARLIKDAVNQAEELALSEGLAYEKRSFYLTFATEDKAEGMAAFLGKRAAQWKGPLAPPAALTVLTTAHLRGDLDLLPRLFTFLRELRARAEGSPVLLADLGGSCAPEVWHCAVTGGRSMLIALDGMGYHAASVADTLAPGMRGKMSDLTQMALVDAEHPYAFSAAVQVVAGAAAAHASAAPLVVRLDPAPQTASDGRVLRLAAVGPGQVGRARLAQGALASWDVLDMPAATEPDPTIAGIVDFIVAEARYVEKRKRS